MAIAQTQHKNERSRVKGYCPYCGFAVSVAPPGDTCPKCKINIVVSDNKKLITVEQVTKSKEIADGNFGSSLGSSYKVSVKYKRCPYCAEDIRAEAVLCRYCGHDLVSESDANGMKSINDEKSMKEDKVLEIRNQLELQKRLIREEEISANPRERKRSPFEEFVSNVIKLIVFLLGYAALTILIALT